MDIKSVLWHSDYSIGQDIVRSKSLNFHLSLFERKKSLFWINLIYYKMFYKLLISENLNWKMYIIHN